MMGGSKGGSLTPRFAGKCRHRYAACAFPWRDEAVFRQVGWMVLRRTQN